MNFINAQNPKLESSTHCARIQLCRCLALKFRSARLSQKAKIWWSHEVIKIVFHDSIRPGIGTLRLTEDISLSFIGQKKYAVTTSYAHQITSKKNQILQIPETWLLSYATNLSWKFHSIDIKSIFESLTKPHFGYIWSFTIL